MEGDSMIRLSEAQCHSAAKLEDDDFVINEADKLKASYPGITESDEVFRTRLKEALSYANTLPIKEDYARRDFLLLEAFYPGFYRKPEIEKWLISPNGYTPDQRLEDFKHVMMNRARRGL
jgi:hypothetical protein